MRRMNGATHLRLVKTEGFAPDERLGSVVRQVREASFDDRARAIADAIAEELGDLRASALMSPARVELSLHVRLIADGEHWVGFTQTADRRGLFVTTYLTRPIGTDLELLVELPDGRMIEAVGTVTGLRTGGTTLPGMELRLASMSSTDAKRWADTIHLASGDFWSHGALTAVDA